MYRYGKVELFMVAPRPIIKVGNPYRFATHWQATVAFNDRPGLGVPVPCQLVLGGAAAPAAAAARPQALPGRESARGSAVTVTHWQAASVARPRMIMRGPVPVRPCMLPSSLVTVTVTGTVTVTAGAHPICRG